MLFCCAANGAKASISSIESAIVVIGVSAMRNLVAQNVKKQSPYQTEPDTTNLVTPALTISMLLFYCWFTNKLEH